MLCEFSRFDEAKVMQDMMTWPQDMAYIWYDYQPEFLLWGLSFYQVVGGESDGGDDLEA